MPRRPQGPGARVGLVLLCGGLGCEPIGSFRGLDQSSDEVEVDDILVVSPATVDFGTVSPSDDDALRTLTLRNAGKQAVTVYGHDQLIGLYGEDADVFTLDAEPVMEIAPGEVHVLPVRFSPPTDGRWEAVLDIQPGDWRVEVMGRGSAPVVGVDDPAGTTAPIGCESSVTVDVFNQGSALLAVEELALDDPWDAWSLTADPTPAYLDPGGRLRLRYTFAPGYADDIGGMRPATVSVLTDDPRQPRSDVSLEGLALQVDGVEEGFTYSPGALVDLLVVADTDGVMGLRIPSVQDAVPALVDGFLDAGASLHTAVVTGESPCPQNLPVWADTSVERLARIQHLQDGLEGERGPASDWLGLHAATALAQADESGCLDGFLRPEARLHVLLVAGDLDRSELRASTQLARIAAEAPLSSQAMVSAILPTDTFGCGGTLYDENYAELTALSGGALIDLCAADLPTLVDQVAEAAMADVRIALERPLDRAPIPESIEVEVDGDAWPHFTYRAIDHTIVFDSSQPPRAGSEVVIRYRAVEEC